MKCLLMYLIINLVFILIMMMYWYTNRENNVKTIMYNTYYNKLILIHRIPTKYNNIQYIMVYHKRRFINCFQSLSYLEQTFLKILFGKIVGRRCRKLCSLVL